MCNTCFRSHWGLYVAPTYSHISESSLWFACEMPLRTSRVTGYRSVLEGCEIFRRWRLSEEVSMGDDVLDGFNPVPYPVSSLFIVLSRCGDMRSPSCSCLPIPQCLPTMEPSTTIVNCFSSNWGPP